MAIKFSQFNESTNTSQVDFIVGYQGNTNVRISPSNLLSALGNYLPLTGGTLTGNLDITTAGGVNRITSAGAFDLASHDSTIDLYSYSNGYITTDVGADLTTISTDLEATSVRITGGTSIEFLKADGSVDTNSYLTDTTGAASYEEGTFDLGWGIAQFGGLTLYTLADFGGSKFENTKYVKIGRLVKVTSVFKYGSRPAAWPTSGTNAFLYIGNLPFSLSNDQSDCVNGTFHSFPGFSNTQAYILIPGGYGGNYGLLGFQSTRTNFYGDPMTLYPYEIPANGGPAPNATLRFSFSFYTDD